MTLIHFLALEERNRLHLRLRWERRNYSGGNMSDSSSQQKPHFLFEQETFFLSQKRLLSDLAPLQLIGNNSGA